MRFKFFWRNVVETVELDGTLTAHEAVQQLAHVQPSVPRDGTLVLVPSPNVAGTILGANSLLKSLSEQEGDTTNNPDLTLGVYTEPLFVRVGQATAPAIVSNVRELLLDRAETLDRMRALFDNLLSAPVKEKEKKRASQQELLIFQVTVKGESSWLHSQTALADIDFDPDRDQLTLFPLAVFRKKMQSLSKVFLTEVRKEGTLLVQWRKRGASASASSSSSSSGSHSGFTPHWCALEYNVLYIFKNRDELTPLAALPLDSYDLSVLEGSVMLLELNSAFTVRDKDKKSASKGDKEDLQEALALSTEAPQELEQWTELLRTQAHNTCATSVFAQPLRLLVKRQPPENQHVPEVLRATLAYLDTDAHLCEEGLLRHAGSLGELQRLLTVLETNAANFAAELQRLSDPHVAATLLKRWLARLPEPLLTWALYERFIGALGVLDAAQADDDPRAAEERAARAGEAILALCRELPAPNLACLHELCRFLRHVAEKEQHNKMGIENIATVIAPNLLRPKEAAGTQRTLGDTSRVTKVVELLIKRSEELRELHQAQCDKEGREEQLKRKRREELLYDQLRSNTGMAPGPLPAAAAAVPERVHVASSNERRKSAFGRPRSHSTHKERDSLALSSGERPLALAARDAALPPLPASPAATASTPRTPDHDKRATPRATTVTLPPPASGQRTVQELEALLLAEMRQRAQLEERLEEETRARVRLEERFNALLAAFGALAQH